MKAKGMTKETVYGLGEFDRKFPKFEVGDAIAVAQRISEEGAKDRTQIFEGDVIAMHNRGVASTFMVRKIAANSVSVERIFPYYSPLIESITIVRKGDVCRAKLYYMRDRIGKAARVKEKILTREQKASGKAAAAAAAGTVDTQKS